MTFHMPSRWYEPRDVDDTDEARDREADAKEQHDIDVADARREEARDYVTTCDEEDW